MAKQLYPNIVRGGMAIPLGNNYYFMKGRKHNQGGIDVGKDLEVEGGEIMKLDKNNVKVFSAVPFLNGRSPVEKILGGENPNKVFAQQERFKKVNKINDDGTKAKYGKRKINTETIPESEQYAVTISDKNNIEDSSYIKRILQAAKNNLTLNLDVQKERFYNHFDPYIPYTNENIKRAVELFVGGPEFAKKEHYKRQDIKPEIFRDGYLEGASDTLNDAIWATYLGIPKEKRRYNSQLEKSEYKPTKSPEYNKYYKLPLLEDTKKDLIQQSRKLKFGENEVNDILFGYNMGYSTIGRGLDYNKGEYVSYADTWDINPLHGAFANNNYKDIPIINKLFYNKGKDIFRGITNPIPFYDRIYLDDYYNANSAPKNGDYYGGYLPEIIVTNNENNQYKYGGEKINNENNIDYIYDKIDKSNKNFAKRLRDKNRKHIINWEDTTQISTHKLGVATDNKGNHYIYPEIQEVNGQLVDYTRPPFNKTAGMINAEKTGDTVRVNSIEDGVKFTQEYKNRYMNKKQLGGKANIYRLDSNGKSGLRMNISTGDETKARKKALLGTEDPYLSINDSYRHFVDRSKFMEEWRKRNMLYANNPIGDKPDVNKLAKEIVTKPSNAIFIEAPKDIKINYSQGLKDYAKNATTIKPSINWNKIGTAIKPYAGSIIDTVGNIATSLINASTLNKMKYTKQPIPQIANKLKTSVNINPQLKTLNESYNQYTDYINNNTASSKVAREALQRARIKNVLDTNTLYATKENTETELINKDRINQQTVANANVDNYNKWLAGKAEFDNAILDKKSENIVGAINNITSSFNTSINNIKKDRQFNNNLISVLAANPNVNPEYLRALGADWVTDKMIEDWKLANKKK